MLVIPVNQVVDKKRILGKRRKGTRGRSPLTPPPKKKIIITHIFPADLYACN
jgi:hypothetical protein